MDAPISSPMTTRSGASRTASSAMSSQQSPSSNPAMPVAAPVATQAPSTDAFLNNFTLVAEAAKRAQVAVMVRDFENCAL